MKQLFIAILSFISLTVAAQTAPFFGTISYDSIVKSMPEYIELHQLLNDLQKQYDAELANAEKEFNEKYELFLEQQGGMEKAIRLKRQSELQLMLENNASFRTECKRKLTEQENAAMVTINSKVQEAIKRVGDEKGLIAIINTDNNACPYTNPNFAVDVTQDVVAKMRQHTGSRIHIIQ